MNYNTAFHSANTGWNSFHLILETGLIIRTWGPKNASGCVSGQRECLCLLVLITQCWYPGDGKELIKLFILAGLVTGSKKGRVEGCSFPAEQQEVTISSQKLSKAFTGSHSDSSEFIYGHFFKNTFITSFNDTTCFSQSLISRWWQPKRLLLCPNFCLGHVLISLLASQFTTNSVCFL